MRHLRLLPLVMIAAAACTPAVSPTQPAPHAATTPAPVLVPPPAGTTAPAEPDGPQATGYDKPPKALLDVLHAPSPASPHMSPKGDRMILVSTVEYPPMSRVAEPFLRLAGVRVETRNRSKHDTPGGYGIRPCSREFTIATVPSGTETKIALPKGCASGPSWSADGTRFYFQNAVSDAVELYIGDGKTGELKKVPGIKLNPMLDSTVQWIGDGKTLLVKSIPENVGAPPAAPTVPMAPSIQESIGDKGESSTYETRDTLNNKHDEDLFDYYATSQLAVIDASSQSVRRVGKPGLFTRVDTAPDGVHVLVQSLKKPYSYVTTHDRFPYDVSVWDLPKGDAGAQAIASLPLADRVPVHGVPKGPRHFSWRSTDPATLIWAEALDGGDWKTKVPQRDKVMMQKAPFTSPPVEVARTEQRFTGFTWMEKAPLAFMHEHDENRHWRKVFVVNIDDKASKAKVLWDLSTDEKYKNPGSFVMKQSPNGEWFPRQEGDSFFLHGSGASPAGDRPFLDRMDLKSGKTERIFRSEGSAHESFIAFASQEKSDSFLTWHQSPSSPPNAYLRTVGKAKTAPAEEATFESNSTAVTHIPDPTPEVRGIKKRLVKYKRKDGMDLSFTLFTPPDYKEGTRVPAILNAYPLDFADAKKAGQVTGSEQTFTRLKQYKLLLLAGYAIIDQAQFPIVGDPKKAYDTYMEQLIDDAKAAVDKAVELGVVDRDKVGITGHSHGALMTANLLAHTDIFRAGAATSGSYNKTLTPFGFQNERRSVWEAQNVYVKASPFFYADKMKLPILIVHGEDDANPGTTPLQAHKLYEAIRGNGGTARLVMLPHEPHWYTAMESNEQLIAEMLKWFDKYVKNAGPKGAAPAPGAPAVAKPTAVAAPKK